MDKVNRRDGLCEGSGIIFPVLGMHMPVVLRSHNIESADQEEHKFSSGKNHGAQIDIFELMNMYLTLFLQQATLASVLESGVIMHQLKPLHLFKNLSDETRLNLVLLLREKGELCVCELSSILKETQPKISRHLALLREGGLLLDRRDGKWIHYRLSPHMPAWAAAIIEQAYLCQRDDIMHLSQQAERDNVTTNGKPVCM